MTEGDVATREGEAEACSLPREARPVSAGLGHGNAPIWADPFERSNTRGRLFVPPEERWRERDAHLASRGADSFMLIGTATGVRLCNCASPCRSAAFGRRLERSGALTPGLLLFETKF